jgi:hypothetical protein
MMGGERGESLQIIAVGGLVREQDARDQVDFKN